MCAVLTEIVGTGPVSSSKHRIYNCNWVRLCY